MEVDETCETYGKPIICIRVAEVVQGHGGPPPKSLDSDENFKPEHKFFLSQNKIYAVFEDL